MMGSLKVLNRNVVFSSAYLNPVRNSSLPSPKRSVQAGRCDSKPGGALNPVRDLSLNGINPAGIILKYNPAAEQRGYISNGVNERRRR